MTISARHHQPINAPTAGAQAFLMDYPQGEGAITHHAGPVRVSLFRLRISNKIYKSHSDQIPYEKRHCLEIT
jgi:hypothetical protein